MLLSVTLEKLPLDVPPLLENAIVDPPLVNKLAFESFAVRVTVIALPEAIVEFETDTMDCEREIAPGLTVTVGRAEVILDPPIVAVIVVAVPEATPVNVAV